MCRPSCSTAAGRRRTTCASSSPPCSGAAPRRRLRPGRHAELALPDHTPQALTTIPAIVRAQQFAHALAEARELDPDAPAGLTKVTATH